MCVTCTSPRLECSLPHLLIPQDMGGPALCGLMLSVNEQSQKKALTVHTCAHKVWVPACCTLCDRATSWMVSPHSTQYRGSLARPSKRLQSHGATSGSVKQVILLCFSYLPSHSKRFMLLFYFFSQALFKKVICFVSVLNTFLNYFDVFACIFVWFVFKLSSLALSVWVNALLVSSVILFTQFNLMLPPSQPF